MKINTQTQLKLKNVSKESNENNNEMVIKGNINSTTNELNYGINKHCHKIGNNEIKEARHKNMNDEFINNAIMDLYCSRTFNVRKLSKSNSIEYVNTRNNEIKAAHFINNAKDYITKRNIHLEHSNNMNVRKTNNEYFSNYSKNKMSLEPNSFLSNRSLIGKNTEHDKEYSIVTSTLPQRRNNYEKEIAVNHEIKNVFESKRENVNVKKLKTDALFSSDDEVLHYLYRATVLMSKEMNLAKRAYSCPDVIRSTERKPKPVILPNNIRSHFIFHPTLGNSFLPFIDFISRYFFLIENEKQGKREFKPAQKEMFFSQNMNHPEIINILKRIIDKIMKLIVNTDFTYVSKMIFKKNLSVKIYNKLRYEHFILIKLLAVFGNIFKKTTHLNSELQFRNKEIKEQENKTKKKPITAQQYYEICNTASDSEQNKGCWTDDEDNILLNAINKYGPINWAKISTIVKTRSGKQCRERWHNHLHPCINKTKYKPYEDLVIILLQKSIGNKWSEIAKYLDGRPDNSIKNHWNSKLCKMSVRDFLTFCKDERGCRCKICLTMMEFQVPNIENSKMFVDSVREILDEEMKNY